VPLVGLDGGTPPDEIEISDLAGYGGARPIRIGNAAAGQAQLDVPGDVLELATSLARASALPDELASAVPILAGWLVEHWREPDNGIWEIRGVPARYTHSLVSAVSGFQGAAALADQRFVSGDAAAWRRAGTAAAADLGATGALELRIDGGGADAALAQAALLGGLEAIAHRVDSTLDLIAQRLDRGGLVDRYEGQQDMIADPCAPFVFPTFWLAGALAATGRDGSRWLEAALDTSGPLGLFGEVADPVDHAPLGNYPQVQSHAAFVLAVAAPGNAA
jgi:GH15 family glucan-1,4-alpha-glucosidase